MRLIIIILLLPYASSCQGKINYFSTLGSSPRNPSIGNRWIGIQGQSNGQGLSPKSYLWSGQGSTLSPLPTDSFNRVMIYDTAAATRGFRKLKVGTVSFNGTGGGNIMGVVNNGSGYEDGFGPEVGLALRWTQMYPFDTLFITKMAIGGATIQNYISPGGGYFFLFQDVYNASKAILNVTHPGLEMSVILFDQGEANGADNQATYYGYLQTYISQQQSNFLGVDGSVVLVLKSSVGVRAAQLQAISDITGTYGYDSVPYLKLHDWDPNNLPYSADFTHYHPEYMLFSGGRDFFNIAFNATGSINGL